MGNISVEILSDTLKTVLMIASSTVEKEGASTGLDSIWMELNPATKYQTLLIHTSSGDDYTEIDVNCAVMSMQNNITEFPRIKFERFKKIIDTVPLNTNIKITDEKGVSIYIGGSNRAIVMKDSGANQGAMVLYNKKGNVSYDRVIMNTAELHQVLKYASKVYSKDEMMLMHNCIHVTNKYNQKSSCTCIVQGAARASYHLIDFLPGSSNDVDVLLNIEKTLKVIPHFQVYDSVQFEYDAKYIMITGVNLKPNPDGIIPGFSNVRSFTHYQRFNPGIFPNIESTMFGQLPTTADEMYIPNEVLQSALKRVSAITDYSVLNVGFDLMCYESTFGLSYESVHGQIQADHVATNTLSTGKKIIAKLPQNTVAALTGMLSKDDNIGFSTKQGGLADVILFRQENDDKNFFCIISMMPAQIKNSIDSTITAFLAAKNQAQADEQNDDTTEPVQAVNEAAVTVEPVTSTSVDVSEENKSEVNIPDALLNDDDD